MAVGVLVDRPAFTNWKYRDAFADNVAFALSEQKVCPLAQQASAGVDSLQLTHTVSLEG